MPHTRQTGNICLIPRRFKGVQDMKYRVYAGIGGRGHKWQPYSALYSTLREAETCKRRAEARGILDLYNRPIKYIIREEVTPA